MSRPVGQLNMMTMENLLFGGGNNQLGALDSTAGRGVSALHRRAQQLKRWQEKEDEIIKAEQDGRPLHKKRSAPKIKFSDATLFLAACTTSDYEECARLIDSNRVDINVTSVDGLTALHQACIDDNLRTVNFLTSKGADIDVLDNEGWTPLHAAASCGNTSVVEALLDAGADPRIINNDGELASDLADNESIKELIEAKFKQLDIEDMESLRKQEMFIMMQDVNRWLQSGIVDDKPHPRTGATILHVAAAKGYLTVISTLLNNKIIKGQIDVNARDNEQWTPLAAACYWQHPGACELLMQNGADVELKTTTGQSLDELTDHELIRSMLETRRKKIKEEQAKLIELQKQKEAEEKDKQKKIDTDSQKVSVVSTPTSPATAPTNESETQRKAHAKRARETRRSTQGVSADDVNKAKEQLKQKAVSADHDESDGTTKELNDKPPTPPPVITAPVNAVTVTNTKAQRDICKIEPPPEPKTPPPQQLPAIENSGEDNRNYKRLYDDLVAQHEKLKREMALREQEWTRTKRQQLRKISEFEEEVKLLEQLENDTQRLKDENGALIRVISKLSK